jgi:phenylalanyl-tRNA synthetase beta chain
MQVSEKWLRSYANPDALSSDALAHALTMAGLEVEGVDPVAPPFSGVAVARVVSVTQHPNADKLTVCEVDAGTGALLNIVCGAPNVAAGIKVPCALPGAVLPGDFRIKATTMRGVASQGMLCSARELGLSDDHAGLLILSSDAPIGRDIREALALDDRRFTLKLTPNRGDCLGVVGLAREVAAITGSTLVAPTWKPVPATSNEVLPVRVIDADLCGRFSGRVVRGVNARAATPGWMKERLERSGQRSISALVDISNYVMLEFGRPSHVFDLDKVRGGLQVRWGRAGETVTLLNGQTINVDSQVGVIADDSGVEALAGVMGGEATAVSLDTTNVYLEAAFWWPESIAGRARRFNFSTDAAHRFERGTDFATTAEHLDYLTRLIVDICGTPSMQIGPIDDQVLRLPERKPVAMRIERCRKVIGVDVAADEMAACFARLGLAHRRQGDCWIVTPPSFRFDLTIEEDLIEEVARLWGFDRIPALPPKAPAAMRARSEAVRALHDLRRQCAQLGYQELVNYAFVERTWEQDFGAPGQAIDVVNPIASQMAVMRTNLIGSLISALRYNLNRQADRAQVFEIGRVFLRDAAVAEGPLAVQHIAQPLRLGALAYGDADSEQWGRPRRRVDFFDIKGDLELLFDGRALRFAANAHPALHPGRSAAIEVDGRRVGWIGELHPRLQQKYELPQAPVVFEVEADALLPAPLPKPTAVARHPAVERDVALWFDEKVSVQSVIDAVGRRSRTDARLSALRDFRLFDIYRAPSTDSSKVAGVTANALLYKGKSLAFRVVLQDTDRTLSDAEADAAMTAIVEGLGTDLGGELRR